MAPPRKDLGAKLRSQALLKEEAKGEKVKAVKARARKPQEAKAALERTFLLKLASADTTARE